MSLTYPSPNLTQSDPTIFTLLFGPPTNITFPSDFLLSGGAKLPGLKFCVGGNASWVDPIVTYNSSLTVK